MRKIILFFYLMICININNVFAVIFTDEEIAKQVEMIKKGGKKFLIINADDFGMSKNTNEGVIETFLHGILTSATVMMPTPQVQEVAEFQKKYPNADIGVHLTLTSEWKKYRWGPLAPKEKVQTLYETGTPYFWPDISSVKKNVDTEEAQIEIERQIEYARELGINISHLDCHMGWCYLNDDFADIIFPYIEKYRLPHREVSPSRKRKLKGMGIKVIDNLVVGIQGNTYDDLKKSFISHLKKLPIGITEIYFHPARLSDEVPIDSGWEKRDWERRLLLDKDIIQVIKEEDIVLIGYRPLQIISNEFNQK